MILLFDQMTLHQAPVPLPGVGPNDEPLAVFMKKYRIPAVCDVREWARHGGGLATYGPDFNGLFAKAADVTDKIMAGAKPADIPIEAPNEFALTINTNIARQMGLTIPQSALALADEIVQ
jgi:putative ABC transport system substrate-binding protein